MTIITKDLGMRNICAKMGQRLLNDELKKRCMQQVCQDILKELETEPDMLSRVVTGDELLIFKYDVLIKRQSLK